ncbi:MAG: hypothetical protein JW996_07510, partial [Candidatus Cloacimonetes bacterium]|nr:hypothetical protein [Candidatus Cloacimonadota bacterium]
MGTNLNLADLINTRKNIIQDEIYQEIIKSQPELTARYTQEQLIKTNRDIGYHLSYLKSAIETSSPTIFAEYVAWVKIILQEIGIGKNAFRKELEIMLTVLRHHLPDEYAPVLEQYLNSGMIMLSASCENPESYINRDNPHAKLANAYLD